MLKIKYKKLQNDAIAPYKKYNVDAGFDLTAVWKKETDKYVEYGTGLAFEIPVGYVGLMFPRSSVRNQDLTLKNSVGVVDASYRGEIKFSYLHAVHDIFEDISDIDYELFSDYDNEKGIDVKLDNRNMDKYGIGDRVGQIVFVKIPDVKMVESEELSDTERGTAGYGSSGK